MCKKDYGENRGDIKKMNLKEYLKEISSRYLEKFKELKRREELRGVVRIEGPGNIVIRMDEALDLSLREIIAELGIPVIYFSEDTGKTKIGEGEPEYFILADPLDGSRNFMRGIPFYGFSIALADPKNPTSEGLLAGVVGDFVREELFITEETYPKSEVRIGEKPIISSYDYGFFQNKSLEKLRKETACRTLGAMAIEVCYVAIGKLDAVVELRYMGRPVDIAAASLFLRRNGGIFVDPYGKPLTFELNANYGLSFIAARDEEILTKIMKIIDTV